MKRMLAMAALLCLAGGALAQDAFPNKSIVIVVPTGPSGQTDVFARLIAEQLRRASTSRWWSRTSRAPAARSPGAISPAGPPTATR